MPLKANMNKIKSIEEFEICMDVTTRMALIALSLVSNDQQLPKIFDDIRDGLIDEYTGDKFIAELITKLIDQYKNASLILNKEMKKA